MFTILLFCDIKFLWFSDWALIKTEKTRWGCLVNRASKLDCVYGEEKRVLGHLMFNELVDWVHHRRTQLNIIPVVGNEFGITEEPSEFLNKLLYFANGTGPWEKIMPPFENPALLTKVYTEMLARKQGIVKI